MVAALKFDDADYHNLIDLLVEAVKVTEATGHRPSVLVDGRTYAPYELTKVAAPLPHNEPLNERHAALVATIFDRRQRGYGRTAYKLAHRANQIASDTVSWSWMRGGATPKEAEQAIPTIQGEIYRPHCIARRQKLHSGRRCFARATNSA